MGVIKFSSADSRDFNINDSLNQKRVNSTPDPYIFSILKKEIINGYLILLVKYPNVINYEGKKILMYSKYFDINLINNRIDPHFFNKGDSPIARFEPTSYGWELAVTLASNLS